MWVVLLSVDPIDEKSDQITRVLLEIYKENSELDKRISFFFFFHPIFYEILWFYGSDRCS